MSNTSPRPMIIDCDTGRDDALTLAVAVRQTAVQLVGVVTSYGNVPLKQVTENTARVMALLGKEEIPIFPGAAQSSQPELAAELLAKRHAGMGNGLCNLELPPTDRTLRPPMTPEILAGNLQKLAKQHGALDYVIIGPATNFAAVADVLGAKLPQVVNSVTMMGGKLGKLWDEVPGGADFNIACDPKAAQRALNAGVPARIVPMNVTWPIALGVSELEALQPVNKAGTFAKELMLAQARHFAPDQMFRFHDPSVLIAMSQPQGFKPETVSIGQVPGADFGRVRSQETGVPVQVYQSEPGQKVQFLAQMLPLIGIDASGLTQQLQQQQGGPQKRREVQIRPGNAAPTG